MVKVKITWIILDLSAKIIFRFEISGKFNAHTLDFWKTSLLMREDI